MISLAALTMIFFWIYLSIRRNRNLPKRRAAERLFEAFQDDIQRLNCGNGDVFEILDRAWPRQEKAYLEFRSYLIGKALREFDAAWIKYSCWIKEKPQTILSQIFPEGCLTVAHERRQLGLEKILEFLSLARKFSHLPPR